MTNFKSRITFVALLSIVISPFAYPQNFWEPTAFVGQANSICVDLDDRIFAGEINQGVFRSTDDGTNWFQVNNGVTRTNINSMAAGPAGDIFAGADLGALFRSTDGGENWEWISDTTSGYVYCIAIDSLGTIFYGTGAYFGSRGYLFRSTDNGANWDTLDLGVVPLSVQKLALTSTGNLYAGVDTFGVFRSTDNGDTWQQSLSDVTVTALVANTDGHLFAGTFGSDILKSTDAGVNWTPVNSGFPGQMVRSLSRNSAGDVFASVQDVTFGWGLVYRSTDDGTTWDDMTSGTDSTPISSIAFNSGGFAYASSDYGAMFRSVSPTTGVDGTPDIVPATFALFQNYPNPFNPSTTFNFQLPSQGHVTLKLFDLYGREVATLMQGVETPGTKTVRFSAAGLASGVYYYRLQAGDYSQTRKLVLLR